MQSSSGGVRSESSSSASGVFTAESGSAKNKKQAGTQCHSTLQLQIRGVPRYDISQLCVGKRVQFLSHTHTLLIWLAPAGWPGRRSNAGRTPAGSHGWTSDLHTARRGRWSDSRCTPPKSETSGFSGKSRPATAKHTIFPFLTCTNNPEDQQKGLAVTLTTGYEGYGKTWLLTSGKYSTLWTAWDPGGGASRTWAGINAGVVHAVKKKKLSQISNQPDHYRPKVKLMN